MYSVTVASVHIDLDRNIPLALRVLVENYDSSAQKSGAQFVNVKHAIIITRTRLEITWEVGRKRGGKRLLFTFRVLSTSGLSKFKNDNIQPMPLIAKTSVGLHLN